MLVNDLQETAKVGNPKGYSEFYKQRKASRPIRRSIGAFHTLIDCKVPLSHHCLHIIASSKLPSMSTKRPNLIGRKTKMNIQIT
jgi:hypothetical protein